VGIFGLQSGALAEIGPDGGARIVATDLLLPNGQALSRDGRTLLVAESAGQRITAFELAPDGAITDRRLWAEFGEPVTARTLPEVVKQVRCGRTASPSTRPEERGWRTRSATRRCACWRAAP
jgi:hypothetical protein